MVDGNVQIVQAGVGLSNSNPLPVNDPKIGAKDDAAVTNPANEGSVIALLKGVLTGVNGITTVSEAIEILVDENPVDSTNPLPTANADIGAKADAAVTNPALDASMVALLKGLLTAINTLNTAVTTLNTNIGTIADVAVTNPANEGTLIALTKGVLTNTGV